MHSSFFLYALLASVALLAFGTTGETIAPDLGACASFALHGHAGVAAAGTDTIVYGDVGGDDAITGFGTAAQVASGYAIYQSDESAAINCAASKDTAYLFAAGTTCHHLLPVSDLAGLTLLPGVYCISSGYRLTSGALTLDGDGSSDSVFLFQTATDIITSVNTDIILTNGAQEENVYWQTGSAAQLADYSTFRGTILAYTAVNIGVGTTLVGRALAKIESVTLAGGDTIALPKVTVPENNSTATATIPENNSTATTTGTNETSSNSTTTRTTTTGIDDTTGPVGSNTNSENNTDPDMGSGCSITTGIMVSFVRTVLDMIQYLL